MEIHLSEATKKLMKQVEQIFSEGVGINVKKETQLGYVRHDQAQQYLRGGKLMIDIYDMTKPDYTVAHELLHFLHMFNGAPQISFNLTTKKKDLDVKFMATGLEIYDIVMHDYVYTKQHELDMITDDIKELYFKGVLSVLKPETKEKDTWMVLRILTLLDTLLFFKEENNPDINTKLRELYPKSFAIAQRLYAILTEKNLDTAFAMRRTVVKLFKVFDEELSNLGMIPMNMTEFATLSVVLSERQMNLQVRQLFNIVHSPLDENLTFKSAYIGQWKNDGQNSFVLTEPKKEASKKFIEYYDMKVTDFLDSIGVDYLKR